MEAQKVIKNRFERNEKALTLRPTLGFGTGVSIIRIIDGLTCEIKEGKWELKTDMPEQLGGDGSAPTPGVLGRAALGSCLATGYMMWASKLDIIIDSLEIRIEADYDDGGLFATSESPPGYSEIRYQIYIKSPISPLEIEKFLDKADKHSPYLDVFRRSQSCKREVEFAKNKK